MYNKQLLGIINTMDKELNTKMKRGSGLAGGSAQTLTGFSGRVGGSLSGGSDCSCQRKCMCGGVGSTMSGGSAQTLTGFSGRVGGGLTGGMPSGGKKRGRPRGAGANTLTGFSGRVGGGLAGGGANTLTGFSGRVGGGLAGGMPSGGKKKSGGTSCGGQSAWIAHVKKVAKEKGIKYGEALKVASKSYK